MKTKKNSKTKFLPSAIVLFCLLVSFMRSIGGNIFYNIKKGISSDTWVEEEYHSLEIIDINSEVIPDYNGKKTEDGYVMYRFDLTVENKGTYEEYFSSQLFYVSSGDGYASTEYDNLGGEGEKRDTRILPPGRTGIVTVYGEVSEDSTTVELETYQTEDGEAKVYPYTLPQ